MAGAGAKLFVSGDVLTAAQVNTYLMDQSIMRFASEAARDAAFGGTGEPVLAEGMFAYTTDTNTLWLYNGSSWVNLLGSDIGEQQLSNRNVVINGAMQVAQRGTSEASITGNGYYTADRWQTALNTLGTWTQSVEADAPTGSGFRNSLKMLCTTADASPAASDIAIMNTRFEGQNLQQFLKGTASAKQFAVSFWVKSNVTGTYIAELLDLDNSRQVSASYTVAVSGTWEKKTIVFPADTTGAFDNDNAGSLYMQFYLASGSDRTSGTLNTTWASTVTANRAVGQTNLAAATSNYWQVTGVQLEAGAVATPFEFEQISETLAKCFRYFQRIINGADQTNEIVANIQGVGATAAYGFKGLLSPMRATPTISSTAANTYLAKDTVGNNVTPTSISFTVSSPRGFLLNIGAASGLTAGASVTILANSATATLDASAEL
jgi:hypothetical protein